VDEQKITKETRLVVFNLSNGSEIQGDVFLDLYEARHSGQQRVGDLLNDKIQFIPVKTVEGVVLLNASHVVFVKLNSEWENDGLITLGKKYTVRIKMLHYEEVEGDIYVNLPEGHCRVKDFINQPVQFYSLFQTNHVLYINRNYILSIQD